MIKTFTENDLVRFLYNELNQAEQAALESQLITNPTLQTELDQLRIMKADLEKVNYSPSSRASDKILRFSEDYQKQSV